MALTDLEITRRCAEAMGYEDRSVGKSIGGIMAFDGKHHLIFDPLHDDQQAMALVKKFDLRISKTLRTLDNPRGSWFVSRTDRVEIVNNDLNHAICECVAKMMRGNG